jgi:hypothetical protein
MAMLWMRLAAGLPACEGAKLSASPLVLVCPVQSTLRILKISLIDLIQGGAPN